MNMKTELTLTTGNLHGQQLDGAIAFRGIPYAAAPTGPRRFLPPQPAASWDGVRDATKWGPKPIQVVGPGMAALGLGGGGESDPTWGGDPGISEDCLFINVTIPDPVPNALAPVMVWVPGGGYVAGSGADFGDGTNFARDHGIVFVSFNYRLGALGFLNFGPLLEDDTLRDRYRYAGNLGLLDQIAALHWVQDNISAFGGDPNRVTIAGVSAGGKSVASLMATPLARGLFQQAISQSGGGDRVLTEQAATHTAQELIDVLGFDSAENLIDADPLDLLKAGVALSPGPGHETWVWCPTIDHDILPALPIEQIESAAAAGIPLLVGNNANEAASYVMFDPSAATPARANLESYFGHEKAAQIIADYETEFPGQPVGVIDVAIMTDERYGVPTQRVADAQSAHATTYRYLFQAGVPGLPPQLTAAHGMEVPFVFSLVPPTGTPADELSAAMGNYWAAFIQTGHPTAMGHPDWPRYNTTNRETLVLDAVPEAAVIQIVADPSASRRKAWEGATWTTSRWF